MKDRLIKTPMSGTYNRKHTPRKGAKCIVFLDHDINNPEQGGSRYLFGKIVDVFNQIITVEIGPCPEHERKKSECNCTRLYWQKGDQIFFPRYNVWTFAEEEKQLSLF